VRRLRTAAGDEVRYLGTEDLTSNGVRALCLYYANRLSFCEVEGLVTRIAGARLVSEDTIWRLV
jgi:hypothetical protein